MEKVLAKTEQYLLYAVVFLFPITALAVSSNPYVVSKLAVLVFGLSLILLVRVVRIISSGKFDLFVGRYDLPVAILAVAYIVSTYFRTPNKMEALLLPGTTTAVVAGALIYYLSNQLKTENKRVLSMVLVISGAVFSLLTLFAFSGIFAKIPQLPNYVKAQSFTPEGGFLPAVIFLGTILPIAVGLFVSEKNKKKKIVVTAASAVVVFGLAVSLFNILPGRPYAPNFPSLNVSWQIAVDSLKASPIFGVGPGNYVTAFNRFRPIAFNLTDIWAVKFATASNYYLTLLTEAGMLGLFAMALLISNFYKDARREFKEQKLVNWGFAGVANLVALTIMLVSFALFPATVLITVLFFIYLSLNTKVKHTSMNLTTKAEGEITGALSKEQVASRFPALILTIPVVLFAAFTLLRSTQILRGEYTFKKSLDALVKNDAQGTYDLMRQAITLNPRVDRYHATFSRVNLILANAIATNAVQKAQAENAQKPTISDQDRQNITQLIQQAISEGKSTVALNPLRAGNWENLGRTYQSIIPFAQGADAFAVQSYQQAIALDPLNPNLRIALGGIYYARNDYDNALNIFNLVATTVKPDLANAHFNLAYVLKEKGELDAAVREMTTVLALIKDRNSQDYQTAQKSLEELQGKQAELSKAGTENLTPPQGEQEQVLQPPLELNEDAQPPEAPISPTPTETPAVSPTPVAGSPSPTPLP